MLSKRISSAPFARPADTSAYASGDLVANSTTAASVSVPSVRLHPKKSGLVKISRLRLKKTGTGITNAAFRVHLFSGRPTVTNGDNGVWLPTEAGYIGSFDVTVDRAFSDGAAGIGIPTVGTVVLAQNAASDVQIFFLIEARGAYTPASAEQFTVTAEVEQLDPL